MVYVAGVRQGGLTGSWNQKASFCGWQLPSRLHTCAGMKNFLSHAAQTSEDEAFTLTGHNWSAPKVLSMQPYSHVVAAFGAPGRKSVGISGSQPASCISACL